MNVDRLFWTTLVAAGALALAGPALAQKKRVPTAEAAAAAEAAASAAAPDRADLDRSQIIGNRELPKVTYIVPWKKPGPGDLSGRPLVSVLDEALAPVDRDVFRRQVRYDAQAVAQTPAPAPNAVSTPAAAAAAAATAPATPPAPAK